jgi:hypothetical protein
MIKVKTAVIMASMLLTFAGVPYGQSKPPGPGPTVFEKTEQPQNEPTQKTTESDTKKHGTEDFPFVIKIKETDKTEDVKDGNTTKADDKSTVDMWTKAIVFCTGLIALFNLGLLVANCKLWKTTKKAADAAKKSADALPKIERAYLFTDIVPTNVCPHNDPLKITLSLHNEGKTPAIITDLYVNLTSETTCPADMEKARNIPITEGRVIRGGGSHDRPIPFSSADIPIKPKQKDPDLIAYGRVVYEDIFGDTHTEKFCWHHDSNALSEGVYFRRCSNKEANCHT